MENTRYRWLRLKLEEDILNEYHSGDLFMSQREIMAKYQASYSTVERALRELTEGGTLVRIHGKGTFVCERKGFGNGKNKLAIVMSDNVFFSPKAFYAEVLMQMGETLGNGGYSVIFIHANESAGIEPLVARLTGCEEFCGAVLVGATSDLLIERLYDEKFPLILVDRRTELPGVPYVETDNVDGAYAAVSHLFDCGFRHIGFVSTPLHTSFLERYEGYCNALVDHGCQIARDHCITNLRFDFAVDSLKRLLSAVPPPDALFFANDSIAAHCLKTLRELGVQVPEELSVMGFDGNDVGEHSVPPLATMFVDTGKMGKTAGELMIARLSGKQVQPVLLKTCMIIRESVKDSRKAK